MKKIKLTKRQKKLLEILKFLVVFNLLSIPLHLIIFLKINLYPLSNIERLQASFILNLIGIKHELIDVNLGGQILPAIKTGGKIMAIGEACTSIRSILAFLALVFASPKKLKAKKKGLIYLPIIYIANVFRIVTLGLVSVEMPSLFDLIHIFLWREGLIALIILLWVYWFNKSEL